MYKEVKDQRPAERALLVQAVIGRRNVAEAEDSLRELERLADTAGARVVGCLTQRRERPDAAFFVGQGKTAEIQLACRASAAGMVIFDNELSPVQVNNLDLSLGVKVIDRTELIMQIFARRARTAEAQVQIELAQLQYLAARIPVSERQHRFTGGIGMRGPGESPFQLRRAPMAARIVRLKKKLREMQKHRARTRVRRSWPLVALAGYTNAGKSTLLNALTASEVYVDDRLFATLDTRSRLLYLPSGRKIMLADTVGFIRHLPPGLVASFRSTLEEIRESDMLLVVADAAHGHVREQISVVYKTLEEMGAGRIPRLLLMNKTDRIKDQDELARAFPGALFISARSKDGLAELKKTMAGMIPAAG